MAINIIKKGIEVERLVGQQEVQLQVRAEALVPGAGRESAEALMADGFVSPRREHLLYRHPSSHSQYKQKSTESI